ncbi:glutaredoxin family protein [Burkholderia singularis]|uniref:Thiol-disulfide isomerase and thioredoxins n=1 Tax=Burkholderia singularis TaxID=1503053 RepID=A0A238HC84_9BURK|nr:glutaredoxin family protein [Burkholderia singularis]SMG03086.1 Thiol-disulfide isomerase and thioredoxins [Burkholderia singularis]
MKPATRAAVRFTLYGRGWCHLCDDMRDALAGFIAERRDVIDASVDYVDIDADPALVARYDEDVPVLLLDGVQVCRHRFDVAQAQAALARCVRRPER